MTTDITLFSKIISLPPNLKEDVLKYINYLLFSQGQEITRVKPKKRRKRVLVGLILLWLPILMRL